MTTGDIICPECGRYVVHLWGCPCKKKVPFYENKYLSYEEEAIKEVLLAARKVQEFLWGDINKGIGGEEFRRMLRKRLAKLDEVDLGKPYWRVEFRKRLLQVAAIAVNAIGKLDGGYDFVHKGVPSNLPQHADKVEEEVCEHERTLHTDNDSNPEHRYWVSCKKCGLYGEHAQDKLKAHLNFEQKVNLEHHQEERSS
jgi:hypothetical protein